MTIGFEEETITHHNEICLFFDTLGRMIGFHEDEFDYYYVYSDMVGKIHHASCVLAPVYLKGYIEENSYDFLDNVFKLNEKPEEIDKDDLLELRAIDLYKDVAIDNHSKDDHSSAWRKVRTIAWFMFGDPASYLRKYKEMQKIIMNVDF